MMSDKMDWSYWDDQLDWNSAVDQSHPTRLDSTLYSGPTISPVELTTKLGPCDLDSQSQECRDPDSALLNLQDRNKLPCSNPFLQQVYELRKFFAVNERPTPYEVCQIAAKIGLRDIEVSIWFQTERDLHAEWHKLDLEVSDTVDPSPLQISKTPTFLERVHALRESFRGNLICTEPQLLYASSELELQEYEVSLWPSGERCIQLDLMMSNIGIQQVPAPSCFSGTDAQSQTSFNGIKYGAEGDESHCFESVHQEAINMPISQIDTSLSESCLGTRAISTRPDSDQATDAPEAKRRKKCTVEGNFACLFTGCPSKTLDISRWRDHQSRKHFPRQIWICWMKKSDGSLCKHGPVHRADNFMTHLNKEHNQIQSSSLLELIKSKSQSVTNLFHDRCGFCKDSLNTWDESMKHIGLHLSRGIDPSEWDHCCSSSHVVREYVEKEIVDLPQPPSSAIPLSLSPPVSLDSVYEEPLNTCPSTIVLDGIKEVVQAPSSDTLPDVQNSNVILTQPLKDCRFFEYSSTTLPNSSCSTSRPLIENATSVLSTKKNHPGVLRRGCRRGPLSKESRKNAALVRKMGACVPCRIMKRRCSSGDGVCESCLRHSGGLIGALCIRYKFSCTPLYKLANFTEELWLKSLINGELISVGNQSGMGRFGRREVARLLALPPPPYEPFSWLHKLSTVPFRSSLQFALVSTPQGLIIKIALCPALYHLFLGQEFLLKKDSILFVGKEIRVASVTFQTITVILVGLLRNHQAECASSLALPIKNVGTPQRQLTNA